MMEKKILVAIDGSVYSLNSLDYLILLFGKEKNIGLHLMSIVSSGSSDQNWMFDVDPLRSQSPVVEQKVRTATRYLKGAKEKLLHCGLQDEQVTYSTETSSGGIGMAIQHAAAIGLYDALLIGRRGVGKMGEMFFGSVSSYLVEHNREIPLWLIDGKVSSNRFLLAVHSLPASLMAADHLGYVLHDNPGAEICLYHSSSLFGMKPTAKEEDFHDQWGKTWCDEHLDMENYLFHAHAQILLDNGIAEKQISQLKMSWDVDPSRDLLRKAKKHNCGTIVVGRRGKNINKGLFGGVSDRTAQYAQNTAVWLVG